MADLVLITGGGGFIGRHIIDELLERGWRVRVLDALIDQVHGSGHPQLPQDVELVKGDVRDPEAVSRALQGVDCVIHLAAEVGVGQSMYEIARYVGANDLGTAVLLEALINHPVQRIVVASSMSVYGEGLYRTADDERFDHARRSRSRVAAGLWDPVDANGGQLSPAATDEEKPVDLASIYALTKYVQERSVLIFGRAYGVETVALRLFNVFGAGQALSNPYTGVLANFAARLANRERPLVFEDGAQRRDFIHVRDVATAFRLALERPGLDDVVLNIGSGRSYAIRDVATMLAEAMGVPDLKPDILGKTRSGDIRNCYADISKARALLGFEPAHRLEDSLAEIADWVRDTVALDRSAQMRSQLEAMGLVS
ncbi:NAD-dependent epimerase/dehydratase family protein [Mesorhizobium sp. BR1-1-16]|uniref:NAD-dependent epimerase/dehydratase family protein n=1 Tax=Mesorhizobium sp. BR1-1-16 TaxID=2876653 RepID=UPI001CCE6450|nr:NAD-dependent epimerase/dehydratase family protein [Mesorhizobium sp. BR1-1-16]MBZ9936967.1 NAD-dependent epimerase/dehydratase family protein [Mesorhizobium sp. BR1-1-16]